MEKARAVMLLVAHRQFQARCFELGGGFSLRDDRKIGNELAAPAKISCDLNPGELRVRLQAFHGMFKKCRGLMQVQLRFAALRNGEILKYLGLQRGAKAFDRSDAVLFRGGFELSQRAYPERFMKFQYLVRTNARDCEKLQHARGYFLSQLL